MTTLQREAYGFINSLSEARLEVFMRFVKEFIKDAEEDYWKMVIETDLTDEEHSVCDEARKEYNERPDSFVTLDDLLDNDSLR